MDFALDDDQQLIVDTVRRFADRDLRAWSADADRAGAAARSAHARSRASSASSSTPCPPTHDGMLEGAFSHTTRALRGFELGRGCAALAALLETNVEPALAVARWGSAAAKQALFASLASGGLATLAHDSRGTLEIADGGGELRVTGKLGPVPALAARATCSSSRRTLVFLRRRPTACKRDAITPSGWRAAQWAHRAARWPSRARRLRARARRRCARARARVGARVARGARGRRRDRRDGVRRGVREGARPVRSADRQVRVADPAARRRRDRRGRRAHARAVRRVGARHATIRRAFDLASRARVLAGDVVARATIDAVQIFGGYGFVNDYPVEKLMRDARAFEALHGDERLGRVLAQKAVACTWTSFTTTHCSKACARCSARSRSSRSDRSRSSTIKKSRCRGS